MDILLELPLKTMDDKLYLIAGKILLYYAENHNVSLFSPWYSSKIAHLASNNNESFTPSGATCLQVVCCFSELAL